MRCSCCTRILSNSRWYLALCRPGAGVGVFREANTLYAIYSRPSTGRASVSTARSDSHSVTTGTGAHSAATSTIGGFGGGVSASVGGTAVSGITSSAGAGAGGSAGLAADGASPGYAREPSNSFDTVVSDTTAFSSVTNSRKASINLEPTPNWPPLHPARAQAAFVQEVTQAQAADACVCNCFCLLIPSHVLKCHIMIPSPH
jgi:hypothetical protein